MTLGCSLWLIKAVLLLGLVERLLNSGRRRPSFAGGREYPLWVIPQFVSEDYKLTWYKIHRLQFCKTILILLLFEKKYTLLQPIYGLTSSGTNSFWLKKLWSVWKDTTKYMYMYSNQNWARFSNPRAAGPARHHNLPLRYAPPPPHFGQRRS